MGFANIAANNGWSMAWLGAGIVMTGLIVLSLAISQIHKLVEFWESRQRKSDAEPEVPPVAVAAPPADQMAPCPINLEELAARYAVLTEPLDSPFALRELYRLAGESDLPHPHITIRCLREAGLLTMEGDGLFSWKR
jgi:hypothetical protein